MNSFQLLFGDLLQLWFGFSGRINRAKYWLTFIIYLTAVAIFFVVFSLPLCFPTDVLGIFLIVCVPGIPIIISTISVAIKRLHDRNKSGWWFLVFYMPA
jgi:uncharacterized membrane protein YhaH (DUF805 family)